jgi:NTE family protein
MTAPQQTRVKTAARGEIDMQKKERHSIGLCLSGGGYRAALFHLGACRRLNELGILNQLYSVSSVSGGSVFAAFLSRLPWTLDGCEEPNPFSSSVWSEVVAEPLRRLCQEDIRTNPILLKLQPWRWGKPQAIELLAKELERHIGTRMLSDLPSFPRFTFCATNLGFGVNWGFEKARIGDYQTGYLYANEPLVSTWPLSLAVAISACFPPVFNAFQFRAGDSQFTNGHASDENRDRVIKNLRLNDGGNYDNLGLEPQWKTRKVLFVSDGGGVFEHLPDAGVFWRLLRYISVMDSQARALRRRWLMENYVKREFGGAYWGVSSAAERYELERPGQYSLENAQRYIAKIRTDFDAFSEAEMGILENHGYTLADVGVHRFVIGDVKTTAAPFVLPYPNLIDAQLPKWLSQSKRQRVFGRGWKPFWLP